MTTHNKDKIIAAAKEAGGVELQPYDYGAKCDRLIMRFEVLERFWQIAFEAGRQAERESVNLDDGTIDWRGENEV